LKDVIAVTSINLNKVVVVALPRTGSTLLCSLMNLHPEAYIAGELIHVLPNNRKLNKELWTPEKCFYSLKRKELTAKVRFHPEKCINKPMYSLDELKDIGIRLFGFKCMAYALGLFPENIKRFLTLLKKDGYSMIWLQREDILRSAVSLCVAHKKQMFHNANNISAGNKLQVDVAIDPDLLEHSYQWFVSINDAISSYFKTEEYIPITYKDITSMKRNTAMRDLFSGLKIDASMIDFADEPLNRTSKTNAVLDGVANKEVVLSRIQGAV